MNLFACCLPILLTLPQIAAAQINSANTTLTKIQTQRTVIAEVESVIRHKEGDIKSSQLRLYGELKDGEVSNYPADTFITVRHAHRDFELFPGHHVLKLERTLGGDWYIQKSSHGEIITAQQREARERLRRYREAEIGFNVEKELCFQKIKQAYDAEIFLGAFDLDDPITCTQHKEEYDSRFRRNYDQMFQPDR